MEALPMMKCGCVGSATCSKSGGKTFDPPIPCCITHDCLEVDDAPPSLAGRIAQCAYLPHGHAPRPSSPELAFFEFHGEDSLRATTICKQCKKSIVLHWPQWAAAIHIARRWYKHERYEETITRTFGAPDEESARKRSEEEADFFRKQTGKFHKDTEVYEATVASLTKRSPVENHLFNPHGAYEFDKYYCGCHGWD